MKNINKIEKAAKNKNLRSTKSLFALINAYFWRSVAGPFIAFVFPIVFVAILGYLLGYYSVIAGSLSMATMVISLNSMPHAIYEFKNSCVLKRIGATPINPSKFIFIVGVYYLLVMVISVLWLFLWIVILFSPWLYEGASITLIGGGAGNINALSIIDTFKYVDWGGLIYSEILLMGIGITLGMVIVSVSKSSLTLQTIGIFITIISLFLAAQVYPPYIVSANDFFNYAGYAFTPFKSVSLMITESWYGAVPSSVMISNFNNINNSSIFDVNTLFEQIVIIPIPGHGDLSKVTVCDTGEKIANLIVPYVWILLFSLISVKKFKWGSR